MTPLHLILNPSQSLHAETRGKKRESSLPPSFNKRIASSSENDQLPALSLCAPQYRLIFLSSKEDSSATSCTINASFMRELCKVSDYFKTLFKHEEKISSAIRSIFKEAITQEINIKEVDIKHFEWIERGINHPGSLILSLLDFLEHLQVLYYWQMDERFKHGLAVLQSYIERRFDYSVEEVRNIAFIQQVVDCLREHAPLDKALSNYQLQCTRYVTKFKQLEMILHEMPFKKISLNNLSSIFDFQLMSILQECKQVRVLDLTFCENIGLDVFEYIMALTDLKTLNISHCQGLADLDLTKLVAMTGLLRLDIRETIACDTQKIMTLQLSTQLKKLKLSLSKEITTLDLKVLCMLTSLHTFSFTNCTKLYRLNISDLATIPSLKVLEAHFFGNKHNHDKGIKVLTGLEKLSLTTCNNLYSRTIKMISRLTNLVELDVSNVQNFSNKSCKVIACLTNLTSLHLAKSFPFNTMDDVGFRKLTSLTNLKVLNISRCQALSPYAVQIFSHYPLLNSLELCFCSELAASVVQNPHYFTSLTELNVSYCDLSKTDFSKVKEFLSLRLLHLYLSSVSECTLTALSKHVKVIV